MKCDKLKARTARSIADEEEMLELGACDPIEQELVYNKDEVDYAIAELKEVAEDACLERDDNSRVIDELEAENRKLKRALWLARAERALSEQYVISNAVLYLENKFNHKFNSVRHELHVWGFVKRKCRAKAKEYE